MSEARFMVTLEGHDGTTRVCADCAGKLSKQPGVQLWQTKRGGSCATCKQMKGTK